MKSSHQERFADLQTHLLAFHAIALPEVPRKEFEEAVATLRPDHFSDALVSGDFEVSVLVNDDEGDGTFRRRLRIDGRALAAGGGEVCAALAIGELRVALDLMRRRPPNLGYLEAAPRAAELADECGRLRARLALAEARIGALTLELETVRKGVGRKL